MNDTSIKPINSVQQSENSSAMVKALAQAQAEVAAQSRPPATRTQIEPQSGSSKMSSLDDVSIHFRVNDKTNDITIFLVDRKSRKVLRSIPASELQKLQIGDLLKLTM